MNILVATTNPAKVAALAERLGSGISVAAPPMDEGLPAIPDGVESGKSAGMIAVSKAIWYSRHIPLIHIIASHGNILVPTLNATSNPILTSRFAGSGASARTSATTLLEAARDLRGPDRRIGWIEALAVARDGELLQSWIAHSPPGELANDLPPDMEEEAGFWVPCVWRCPENSGRRLSELTASERLARRDHWAIPGAHLTDWCRQQDDRV